MSTTAIPKNDDTVLSLLQAHPLPALSSLVDEEYYAYGTAGFRYAAGVMAPVMVRVGLVARLLLSQQQERINDMGVMITASHNDESYNGVKISNPDGSMISANQEALLVHWVNERNEDKWKQLLQDLATTSSTTSSSTKLGVLHVGRDTRSHSPPLSDLLIQAAQAMGVTTVNHGILTTPMLHHIVLYSNSDPKLASREAYLHQMAKAYIALDQALNTNTTITNEWTILLPPLQVDGACGVGYQATLDLQHTLTTLNNYYANRFQARNPPTAGPLNDQCGSEHVQKQLEPPIWYDANTNGDGDGDGSKRGDNMSKATTYCCSVDGDADRIVFFATSPEWTLLDGDKIAVLIATFFRRLQEQGDLPSTLSLGVVQTAYANGASTKYLRVRDMHE
jgi:phosphoacetylglucosamine mutase